jgi:hypothetical protein
MESNHSARLMPEDSSRPAMAQPNLRLVWGHSVKDIVESYAGLFKVFFATFILLGVIDLSLTVLLTLQGQVLFFGGTVRYVDNIIFFSTSLLLMSIGLFGIRKMK